MDFSERIRKILLDQFEGGNAHVDFNQAIDGLRLEDTGKKMESSLHTIWELVEHIRIAQLDILDFCLNPDYEAMSWPEDYWPKLSSPENLKQWDDAVEAFRGDHESMVELIGDPENDLLEPLPHGDGQTLFREAMLVVDHNSYHIGQIVQLRKAMGCW